MVEQDEEAFEAWFTSKGEWFHEDDARDMLRCSFYDCRIYMPIEETLSILDTVIAVMRAEYGE